MVHDHLNQAGGAEKVLLNFQKIYPASPIYTLLYDRRFVPTEFQNLDIRTSFIQKFPLARKKFKWYLMLMPAAFEQFDLFKYDVVLSSASAFAKGVLTRPGALHICYCHTPTRYLWSYSHNYADELSQPGFIKRLLPPFLSLLRVWDWQAAQRVDHFIANSHVVAERIKKYYNREATVIHPPVETEKFQISRQREKYFLVISRFRPYKKADLAIRAFNKLGIPLKIIGTGEQEQFLKSLAGPQIEFLGAVDDQTKARYLANCRALIHPQADEDFGITAVEAMAAGRPVIALKSGGALETVREGETGLFFTEQTWEALAEQVIRFQDKDFDPVKIKNWAATFDRKVFQTKIKEFVQAKWRSINR